MSEKTRLALGSIGAALMLGLLGDGLLLTNQLGLNVGLWVAALLAGFVVLARWRGIALHGGGRWLLLPAVGFALAFTWRDSLGLALANLIALVVCLALAVSRSRAGRVAVAGLGEYVSAGYRLAVDAQVGFVHLLTKDASWREIPRGNWTRQAAPVARGLSLTIPVVLVFGGLFASADAAFSSMVASLFHWDVAEVASHVFWSAFWAWIAGGVIRGALRGQTEVRSRDGAIAPPLGIVETGIVLGSLDILFLTFVLVQLRYFFGGAALVEASVHLTYAEYARRGFFELVAVAALTLLLLLGADRLLRRRRPAHDQVFRVLAGLLVALVFVVMASALQRMRLYVDEFGLTELRLYTTAFMGWLAVVFVWFVPTVLRGRRERFAFGAMVAGFALVVGLNAFSPDAYIVRTNVDRALNGKRFDATYATSLSADAVPTLIEALPSLPESDRRSIARRLLERWSRQPSADVRAWNWGRITGWQAISANAATLWSLTGSGSRGLSR